MLLKKNTMINIGKKSGGSMIAQIAYHATPLISIMDQIMKNSPKYSKLLRKINTVTINAPFYVRYL